MTVICLTPSITVVLPFITYNCHTFLNVGVAIHYDDMEGGSQLKKRKPSTTMLFDDLGRDGRTAITGYELGVVDDAGILLGYPPIHYHHYRMFSGTAVRLVTDKGSAAWPNFIQWREGGTLLSVAASELNHGDDATSGFRTNWNGQAFVIPAGGSVGVDGIFEDIRPRNSAPLRWWVQYSLRGSRMSSMHPQKQQGRVDEQSTPDPAIVAHDPLRLSVLTLSGMRDMNKSHNAKFLTFSSPTAHEAFSYTTSRLPISGRVGTIHIPLQFWHHHPVVADEAYILLASPQQLGLLGGVDEGERCLVAPRTAGYRDAAAFINDVIHTRLAAVAANWTGPEEKRPRVVCSAKARPLILADKLYDRRATTTCFPFQFTRDTVLTKIYVSRPAKIPVRILNFVCLIYVAQSIVGHKGWRG